jgi:hypothetical protein
MTHQVSEKPDQEANEKITELEDVSMPPTESLDAIISSFSDKELRILKRKIDLRLVVTLGFMYCISLMVRCNHYALPGFQGRPRVSANSSRLLVRPIISSSIQNILTVSHLGSKQSRQRRYRWNEPRLGTHWKSIQPDRSAVLPHICDYSTGCGLSPSQDRSSHLPPHDSLALGNRGSRIRLCPTLVSVVAPSHRLGVI